MPENYITCQDEHGSINISEDVVLSIVRSVILRSTGLRGFPLPPARSSRSCSGSSPLRRASKFRSSTVS